MMQLFIYHLKQMNPSRMSHPITMRSDPNQDNDHDEEKEVDDEIIEDEQQGLTTQEEGGIIDLLPY